MSIEERLKRIEDKLGMSWGQRKAGFVTFDEMQRALDEARRIHGTPKQATIKLNLPPGPSLMIQSALFGVDGVSVKVDSPSDSDHVTTITGPAE